MRKDSQKDMTITRTLLSLALLPGVALAQSAAPLLADAAWLSAHVNDSDLVVLYVGPQAEYDAGHIPGARPIDLMDVSLPMDHSSDKVLMLELPPVEKLRATLAALGISDNSRIVVYYGGKNSPFQSATRIVFTLDYLGLGDQTSMLNGGVQAWTAAGKTLTKAKPMVQPGKLTARPTKSVVADVDLVKSIGQQPNYKLIDARAPVYFKGGEATFEKTGHIPGAINIPFSDITGPTLAVDPDHVAELFRAAGIKQGDSIVAYCHVGQQATAVVFAARLLGYPVKLYDGSFQDWAVNNRGPVEK
jgi:thiosulfate/3-mercaptopyruvate sulfurtransferase